jgi:large repetitive protein
VFSLNANLPESVHLWPYSGNIETKVKVLGTNLTGTNSLTFNGTAAAFTVVSSSLITTSVPTGATTGKIEVVTPAGKISSDRPFIVRP